MNREELLKFHDEVCQRTKAIMEKKNRDYGGAKGDDPFANFRRVEAMGICKVEQGFMVRITDKLSRLSTFIESGTLLVSESAQDSLDDLQNYCILLGAYLKEKEERSKLPDGKP